MTVERIEYKDDKGLIRTIDLQQNLQQVCTFRLGRWVSGRVGGPSRQRAENVRKTIPLKVSRQMSAQVLIPSLYAHKATAVTFCGQTDNRQNLSGAIQKIHLY